MAYVIGLDVFVFGVGKIDLLYNFSALHNGIISQKNRKSKSSQDRTRIRLIMDFLYHAMSGYGSRWVGMVIGFPKVDQD